MGPMVSVHILIVISLGTGELSGLLVPKEITNRQTCQQQQQQQKQQWQWQWQVVIVVV